MDVAEWGVYNDVALDSIKWSEMPITGGVFIEIKIPLLITEETVDAPSTSLRTQFDRSTNMTIGNNYHYAALGEGGYFYYPFPDYGLFHGSGPVQIITSVSPTNTEPQAPVYWYYTNSGYPILYLRFWGSWWGSSSPTPSGFWKAYYNPGTDWFLKGGPSISYDDDHTIMPGFDDPYAIPGQVILPETRVPDVYDKIIGTVKLRSVLNKLYEEPVGVTSAFVFSTSTDGADSAQCLRRITGDGEPYTLEYSIKLRIDVTPPNTPPTAGKTYDYPWKISSFKVDDVHLPFTIGDKSNGNIFTTIVSDSLDRIITKVGNRLIDSSTGITYELPDQNNDKWGILIVSNRIIFANATLGKFYMLVSGASTITTRSIHFINIAGISHISRSTTQ